MTTQLARGGSSLAQRMNMAPAQLEMVRRLCISADAPDDALELYLLRCKTLGCDPFSRILYMVNRKRNVKDERTGQWRKEDNWVFQSSIDLARSIAQDSGDYGGQLGPEWSDDGKEWLPIWLSPKPPAAARVAVLRHSFKEPLWVTATYAYYAVPESKFWQGEKGAHQLAKCAEMLALRKAFPQKLAGIYGSEEMDQADKQRGLRNAAPEGAPALQAAPEEAVEASFTPTSSEPIVGLDSPEYCFMAEQFNLLDQERAMEIVHGASEGRGAHPADVPVSMARTVSRALLAAVKEDRETARKALMSYASENGISDDERHRISLELHGEASTKNLTGKQMRALRSALKDVAHVPPERSHESPADLEASGGEGAATAASEPPPAESTPAGGGGEAVDENQEKRAIRTRILNRWTERGLTDGHRQAMLIKRYARPTMAELELGQLHDLENELEDIMDAIQRVKR